MTSAERGPPLYVELILTGGLPANGVTVQVTERRRLVDLLNGPETVFELESASLTPGHGARPRLFESVAIEKTAILVALPKETPEQSRRRAVSASLYGRTETVRVPLTLVVPPLTIEGIAHAAKGMGKVRADPSVFPHFFPVTECRIVMADGSSMEHLPVALVNRDAVAAIALHEEHAPAAPRGLDLRPLDAAQDDPLLRALRSDRPPSIS
jgi:hypothetical protein